jgi:uncharacterized Zn finger protein
MGKKKHKNLGSKNMYQYCEICGKITQHRRMNKVHSIEHDYEMCMECGHLHNVAKFKPTFIGIFDHFHGMGGF